MVDEDDLITLAQHRSTVRNNELVACHREPQTELTVAERDRAHGRDQSQRGMNERELAQVPRDDPRPNGIGQHCCRFGRRAPP